MESDYNITRISDGIRPAIHAYFDLCPESPDGNIIVYTTLPFEGQEDYRVCVASAEGKKHRELAPPTAGGFHSGARPQWIDSQTVAYGVPKPSKMETACVNIINGNIRIVPGILRMYSPIAGLGITCTNELRHIVQPTCEEAVYMMDIENSELRLAIDVSDVRKVHPKAEFVDPATTRFKHTKWSDDGSCFLVVAHNADTPAFQAGQIDPSHRFKSIITSQVVDNRIEHIEYLTEFGHHPVWHPIENAVVTGEHQEDIGPCLMIHRRDDGGSSVLVGGTGNHSAISPDGKHVVTDYYDNSKGRGSVAVIHIETGSRRTLASFALPGSDYRLCHAHPVWSRNGERVYFNCSDTGIPQLYAIDL